MATMPRFTMFFLQGDFGWSETHWYLGPTGTNGLADVITAGQKLMAARVNLLGANAVLQYCRASYDDTWRDSLPGDGIAPSITVSGGTPTAYNKTAALVGNQADNPYSVTLLRASGGTLYRKNIFLSGAPASVQTSPFSLFTYQDSYWWPYYLTYSRVLVPTSGSSSWGFKVRSKETADSPIFNISSMTMAGSALTFTAGTSNFNTGQQVRILGVKSMGGRVNGTWSITASPTPPYVYTIQNWKPNPNTPFVYIGGGTVQAIVYKVTGYTQLLVENTTHRKRGRPFDSPRGRLKAHAH